MSSDARSKVDALLNAARRRLSEDVQIGVGANKYEAAVLTLNRLKESIQSSKQINVKNIANGALPPQHPPAIRESSNVDGKPTSPPTTYSSSNPLYRPERPIQELTQPTFLRNQFSVNEQTHRESFAPSNHVGAYDAMLDRLHGNAAEIGVLTMKMQELTSSNTSLQTENQKLLTRVQSMEQDYTTLLSKYQETIASSQREISEALKEAHQTFDVSNKNQLDAISKLSFEVAQLKDEIIEKHSLYVTCKNELDILQAELFAERRNHTQFVEKHPRYSGIEVGLNTSFNSPSSQNISRDLKLIEHNSEREMEEMHKDYNMLQDKYVSALEELEVLRNELATATSSSQNGKSIQMNQSMDEGRAVLQEARATIASLQNEIESMRETYETQLEAYRSVSLPEISALHDLEKLQQSSLLERKKWKEELKCHIQELQTSFEDQISTLTQVHENEVTEITNKHTKAVNELTDYWRNELASSLQEANQVHQREQNERNEKLMEQFAKERKDVENAHSMEIAKYEEKVRSVQAVNADLEVRLKRIEEENTEKMSMLKEKFDQQLIEKEYIFDLEKKSSLENAKTEFELALEQEKRLLALRFQDEMEQAIEKTKTEEGNAWRSTLTSQDSRIQYLESKLASLKEEYEIQMKKDLDVELENARVRNEALSASMMKTFDVHIAMLSEKLSKMEEEKTLMKEEINTLTTQLESAVSTAEIQALELETYIARDNQASVTKELFDSESPLNESAMSERLSELGAKYASIDARLAVDSMNKEGNMFGNSDSLSQSHRQPRHEDVNVGVGGTQRPEVNVQTSHDPSWVKISPPERIPLHRPPLAAQFIPPFHEKVSTEEMSARSRSVSISSSRRGSVYYDNLLSQNEDRVKSVSR
jgi:hypothetical protein